MTRLRPALALLALLPACELTGISLDLPASILSGDITVDGAPAPVDVAENGLLAFFGGNAGNFVLAAQTAEQAYEVFLLEGVYSAHYGVVRGGRVVPANPFSTVEERIVVEGDTDLTVDIPTATVTATFALDGEAFPASDDQAATFYLRPAGGPDLIALGDSRDGAGSVVVTPGTYDVMYGHDAGNLVPANALATVVAGVEVAGDTHVDVDLLTSTLDLTVTLDGGPFPGTEYDDADILLGDEAAGSETLLWDTHGEAPAVRVIDGTYDLVYRHESGDDVPLNTAARLVDDLVIAQDTVLVHDIVTIQLDATVTLDGAAFPASEYDDGVLSLYDAATDTDTVIGNTAEPFTDIRVIPGTYDVLYSHESGLAVPQNVRGTVVSDVAIDGGPLLVDVQSVEVGADVTLMGEAFPADEYNDANLYLTGASTTAAILIGNTHDGVPTVRVMPGTYDLVYRHESGDDVPQNTNRRLLVDQDISADTTLSTDIEARTVRLTTTLNGAAFPNHYDSKAHLWASSELGDVVLMEETGAARHDRLLITGAYDIIYQHVHGDLVPSNAWAVVHHTVVD